MDSFKVGDKVTWEGKIKHEDYYDVVIHISEERLHFEDGSFLYKEDAQLDDKLKNDYFSYLVSQAYERAKKAMEKFPQPNYVLNKLSEEHGEVVKAIIHFTEGRETWDNVETELIDNLAMLIRLLEEGDGKIGFKVPEEVKFFKEGDK